MALTPHYLAGDATMRQLVDEEGLRTRLSVPLVSGGKGIGIVVLSRREVAPFGPEDIALLDTFAEQAVIAIENVRQFRAIQTANAELETRLAREAATREILEVISQSRDDDRPVFDAVLRNSAILCGASMASLDIMSDDRSHAVLVAHWGDSNAKLIPVGTTIWPMDSDLAPPTSMREGRVVHIPDMADTNLYRSGEPLRVAAVEKEGIRTFLAVPLFSGGRTVGCIEIYRREVRPFSDDEIALVETFAAQAVIAIENVRQFRELQTRLAREAATREILSVISQSRDDDAPVFDVIVRNAGGLCNAPVAWLLLTAPTQRTLMLVGYHGLSRRQIELGDVFDLRTEPDTITGVDRAILGARTIHEEDLAQTTNYQNGIGHMRMLVDDEGIRTRLTVPLVSGGLGIGAILLTRREVAPFTADEIALVETFAAQAVIAIENVRQFKALERLNAELGDRVQEQVGEIERMGRLKRFLPAAVADTVISSGSEKLLSSHRALLGVLFCDIRGFTAFCETAEPEETIEVLQTYHEEMGRLIEVHGAGVDHRMGDGIMVLFNDPLPCDDPAGASVRLAIAMRARMAELCQRWKKMGHRLGFGVGVSLGYATVGMVGSGGRFDYTASGTAINLASRLADEAQDGEILLSPRARTAVEGEFETESRGEITLKGIREPVEVFRLTGIAAA
jgi:GAF domain-containing protein